MLQFRWYQVIVLLGIGFSFGRTGIAGRTSSYIRSEWPSSDIPLHDDVFAIPKGHNAPQQVRIQYPNWVFIKFKYNPRKICLLI